MFASVESENDMCECPYDKTHRMLRKHLQKHIFKCGLNHPDAQLQTCPFNTLHLLSEEEYVNHVINCPDKKVMNSYNRNPVKVEHEVFKVEPNEGEENWDDSDNEYKDYNPKKHIEQKPVLRMPTADLKKPHKKEFYKNERKRLLGISSDEDDVDEDGNVSSSRRKPKEVAIIKYNRDTGACRKQEFVHKNAAKETVEKVYNRANTSSVDYFAQTRSRSRSRSSSPTTNALLSSTSVQNISKYPRDTQRRDHANSTHKFGRGGGYVQRNVDTRNICRNSPEPPPPPSFYVSRDPRLNKNNTMNNQWNSGASGADGRMRSETPSPPRISGSRNMEQWNFNHMQGRERTPSPPPPPSFNNRHHNYNHGQHAFSVNERRQSPPHAFPIGRGAYRGRPGRHH